MKQSIRDCSCQNHALDEANPALHHVRPFGAAILFLLVATCCSCSILNPPPTPQQRAESIGPMLAAAGFEVLPADNAAKMQSLKGLPPATMSYYVNKEGQFRYWFADPYECRCLYLGDHAAYQRYENMRMQERIAREQEEAAQENLEAAQQMEMNSMGPFGFGPGFGLGFGF